MAYQMVTLDIATMFTFWCRIHDNFFNYLILIEVIKKKFAKQRATHGYNLQAKIWKQKFYLYKL